MCDPTGSDMRGHTRNTFRQLSMIGTRDTALSPTHNHKVQYRENHFVLHNGTCRIACRYFTLPEVKQLPIELGVVDLNHWNNHERC